MDFDIVVVGTGLPESIAAAALAKAGYKVAHVDPNPYYGGDNASLTLDELVHWADLRQGPSHSHTGAQTAESPDPPSASSSSAYVESQRKRFTSISRGGSVLPRSRQYAISLTPSIIPSIGPYIDALIASGVARYGGFRLLERVALWDRATGAVRSVPGSKEDVFKSKELSLVQKRRLMRFLMFASGEFEGKPELEGKDDVPFGTFLKEVFSIDEKSIEAIVYALAFCGSPADSTLPALQRMRRYMRSMGRYGPSPFLVGQYGGLGETAQGFCRTSAVSGTTYILGHNVASYILPAQPDPPDNVTDDPAKLVVELDDFGERLRCDVIIGSPEYLPSPSQTGPLADPSLSPSTSYSMARCIAIIDRRIHFPSEQFLDTSAKTPVADGHEMNDDEVEEEAPQPTKAIDTALIVFPPESLQMSPCPTAVHVFITGEGSLSTPAGQRLVYVTMPLQDVPSKSAEELLRPYLDATLSLTSPPSSSPNFATAPADADTDTDAEGTAPSPLFTLFYIEHPHATSPSNPTSHPNSHPPADIEGRVICTPPLPVAHHMSETADSATKLAEDVFCKSVKQLKRLGKKPKREEGEEGEEIESMWPPLLVDAGDEDMVDF